MSPHAIREETLSGTVYQVNDNEELYVFPGLAYRIKTLGGGNKYVMSVQASKIPGLIDGVGGEEVEQTVYETHGQTYVSPDIESAWSVVDYLIGQLPYQFEAIHTDAENGNDYVEMSCWRQDVDDQFLPKEVVQSRIDDGEIIENKENTRAFRRGMNPTTHPTVHHR